MIRQSLAAAIAAFSLATPAFAGLVTSIDSFSGPVGGQSLTLTSNTPASSVVTGLTASQTLGGARKIYVHSSTGVSAANPSTACANCGNSGTLAISNTSAARSLVEVIWDGGGGPSNQVNFNGLGGVDLTSGNTVSDFVVSVLGGSTAGVTLEMNVFDMGGNISSLSPAIFKPTSASTFQVPYSAFSASTAFPANFMAVGAVRLVIDGPGGYLDPIDFIATGSAPAPSTAALLTAGLFGWRTGRRHPSSGPAVTGLR